VVHVVWRAEMANVCHALATNIALEEMLGAQDRVASSHARAMAMLLMEGPQAEAEEMFGNGSSCGAGKT